MAQAQYFIEIGNDYLGKYRRVTGRTRREVELKAAEQLQRWSEQEDRARQRAAIADAKESAREATEEALALIEQYRTVLRATLSVDDRLDWDAMRAQPRFKEKRPMESAAREELKVPATRKLLETLRPALRTKREELERAASVEFQNRLSKWEAARLRHENKSADRAAEVDRFKSEYEAGDPDAVERYVSLVLAGSALPPGMERDCSVAFSPEDGVLVVDAQLPAPDGMPTVLEYRFVASRGVTDEKRMKDKDLADLYEDVVVQLVLRTLHEVFEGDSAGHVRVAVVNGVVHSVDRATGRDFDACIVSCQAEREAFEAIDLGRVEPRACFRSLRGLSASRLIGLQPVQPIRVLNTDDARFIEADGVLDGLEADQNLMTMEWQDFEVLVRDLFNQMFGSKGAEVRVTRTSRDQGVDVVVFDPDPLTGGKTIVQAKRYRNTVPVAAVRELYGTMLNEGAGKGILVTTSHFGASALEFAKDKPLTLVDGAQLLHYMQNHGHRVRIDATELKDELGIGLPEAGDEQAA